MEQKVTADVFDELGMFWAEIADKNQTSRQTQFLKAQLPPAGLILDVACGTGRHIAPLAEAGFEVIGIDSSRRLLKIAKHRSSGVAVVLGDIHALPFRAQVFASAVSMDTSFGYQPTEEADQQSLAEVRQVLKRGGRLILDVFNREQLSRKYARQAASKRLKWTALPLLLRLRSTRLLFWVYRWRDYPSFRLLQKRTVGEGGGWLCDLWVVYVKATGRLLRFRHNVRLYTRGRLEGMLTKAGFGVNAVYGDYELQPFSADSTRLILFAFSR
jgi:SAM-dependent methyltransferase